MTYTCRVNYLNGKLFSLLYSGNLFKDDNALIMRPNGPIVSHNPSVFRASRPDLIFFLIMQDWKGYNLGNSSSSNLCASKCSPLGLHRAHIRIPILSTVLKPFDGISIQFQASFDILLHIALIFFFISVILYSESFGIPWRVYSKFSYLLEIEASTSSLFSDHFARRFLITLFTKSVKI